MSPFSIFNFCATSLMIVILLSVLVLDVLISFIVTHCEIVRKLFKTFGEYTIILNVQSEGYQ